MPPFLGAIEALAEDSDHATVVLVVTDQTGRPPPTSRKTIAQAMTQAAERVKSIHFVLLGTGMRIAAMRAFAAGLVLTIGNTNLRMHASLEAAFESAGIAQSAWADLRAECQQRGYLAPGR
jgi:uncharacterized protein